MVPLKNRQQKMPRDRINFCHICVLKLAYRNLINVIICCSLYATMSPVIEVGVYLCLIIHVIQVLLIAVLLISMVIIILGIHFMH